MKETYQKRSRHLAQQRPIAKSSKSKRSGWCWNEAVLDQHLQPARRIARHHQRLVIHDFVHSCACLLTRCCAGTYPSRTPDAAHCQRLLWRISASVCQTYGSRRRTRIVSRWLMTVFPCWLMSENLTVTIPRSGFDSEIRRFTHSSRSTTVSSGRKGAVNRTSS